MGRDTARHSFYSCWCHKEWLGGGGEGEMGLWGQVWLVGCRVQWVTAFLQESYLLTLYWKSCMHWNHSAGSVSTHRILQQTLDPLLLSPLSLPSRAPFCFTGEQDCLIMWDPQNPECCASPTDLCKKPHDLGHGITVPLTNSPQSQHLGQQILGGSRATGNSLLVTFRGFSTRWLLLHVVFRSPNTWPGLPHIVPDYVARQV